MTSEFGIAVHAMVFLHHKGDMVSSEVLAENICTNPAQAGGAGGNARGRCGGLPL